MYLAIPGSHQGGGRAGGGRAGGGSTIRVLRTAFLFAYLYDTRYARRPASKKTADRRTEKVDIAPVIMKRTVDRKETKSRSD
jgi:hypothetical protein